MLEAVIALAVMTVAVSLFSGMVVSTSRQRVANHEYPIASEAVRTVLEQMRNADFRAVWALYNADPDDDPAGPGTGPGNRFRVRGLDPLEGAPDDLVGTVIFPTLENAAGADELREDSQDASLGMPRDLNGDSVTDDADRAGDYILLPVRVQVDWRGRYGDRHIELFTMLAEFKK